jgi:hypothetical protein
MKVFPTSCVNAKIGVFVAAIQIIVENAADAAGLAPVRDEEVTVAPFLVFLIGTRWMAVTTSLQRRMEVSGILFIRKHRVQIRAAAKPALGCYNHACVHVDGRDKGRLHMRHQRNAAGPELPVIFGGARDLLAEIVAELAEHGGNIDADLFEHAAPHDRHFAAAPRFSGIIAVPQLALEASGGLVLQLGARQFILQPFKLGTYSITQGFEPDRRLLLEGKG